MRLKKPTPLRPPTFSNREKTDAKQKQGDNSQSSHCSHKSWATLQCSKPQTGRSKKSISFSGTVLTRTIMTTLIMSLISVGLVFWLMAPTAMVLHRWSPEASGASFDPVLPSSGETMILSAPKKAPVAAAKCVYSCTASNIHQMPSLQCVM